MPYLNIRINRPLDEEQRKSLLAAASQQVAGELAKPERYVMVELAADVPLLFGGTDAPAAYLELKSIGLPAGQLKSLSQGLSTLLEAATGITPSRIYIEFTDVRGSHWGWNGSTF